MLFVNPFRHATFTQHASDTRNETQSQRTDRVNLARRIFGLILSIVVSFRVGSHRGVER
jgi:hypothetical protein